MIIICTGTGKTYACFWSGINGSLILVIPRLTNLHCWCVADCKRLWNKDQQLVQVLCETRAWLCFQAQFTIGQKTCSILSQAFLFGDWPHDWCEKRWPVATNPDRLQPNDLWIEVMRRVRVWGKNYFILKCSSMILLKINSNGGRKYTFTVSVWMC